MEQIFLEGRLTAEKLGEFFREKGVVKSLLVCGRSFDASPVSKIIKESGIDVVRFSGYTANPTYEEVVSGVETFIKESCEGILAVGGGSAIDVAKCIKLFCSLDADKDYMSQLKGGFEPNSVPIAVIPTTAGTGSESTKFSVIYRGGKKHSVEHESMLPFCVAFVPESLDSLPVYQRKCTLLDALCQAIESWWSVKADEKSKNFSKKSIELILANMKSYISGENIFNREIMRAANLSGRAINITRTTAAHAMSYGFTSKYNLPHGHAVALCLPEVWRYMLANLEKNCVHPKGVRHLREIFSEISSALGQKCIADAIEYFSVLLKKMKLVSPEVRVEDIDEFVSDVNPERLSNNPVRIDREGLRRIYENILMS